MTQASNLWRCRAARTPPVCARSGLPHRAMCGSGRRDRCRVPRRPRANGCCVLTGICYKHRGRPHVGFVVTSGQCRLGRSDRVREWVSRSLRRARRLRPPGQSLQYGINETPPTCCVSASRNVLTCVSAPSATSAEWNTSSTTAHDRCSAGRPLRQHSSLNSKDDQVTLRRLIESVLEPKAIRGS